MKDVYKMTVRFDLTDARERYLAEYMQTLDVKKYQSRNQFVLDAIADYVDLQSITREQHDEDMAAENVCSAVGKEDNIAVEEETG